MPKHMFNTTLDWQATQDVGLWSRLNFRGKTSEYLSRTSMSQGTPDSASTFSTPSSDRLPLTFSNAVSGFGAPSDACNLAPGSSEKSPLMVNGLAGERG
jgi:hypothetical protein